MENILKQLGTTTKKERPAAKFTQDELAKCIDVTERYIMAQENESRAGLPPLLCNFCFAFRFQGSFKIPFWVVLVKFAVIKLCWFLLFFGLF